MEEIGNELITSSSLLSSAVCTFQVVYSLRARHACKLHEENKSCLALHFLSDTLLNVFLAIAVDNLANAHDLSDAEQADQNAEEKSVSHNSLIYMIFSLLNQVARRNTTVAQTQNIADFWANTTQF